MARGMPGEDFKKQRAEHMQAKSNNEMEKMALESRLLRLQIDTHESRD